MILFMIRNGFPVSRQRKLAWTLAQSGHEYSSRGLYQLVYSSGGKIWRATSSDSGQTWSGERLVAAGINPCIAASDSGTYIAFNASGTARLFKYSASGFVADLTQPWNGDASAEAAPVVARNDAAALLVYEKTNGKLGYTYYWMDSAVEWGEVPGAGDVWPAMRPALSATSTSRFALAWMDAGDNAVYYCDISIFPYPPPLVFWQKELISNPGWSIEGAPSVTFDALGYPAVAWASRYMPTDPRVVNFRQKLWNGWGTQATIIGLPDKDLWAPTLMSATNISYDSCLRIAHNEDTTDIMIEKLQGPLWQQSVLSPNLPRSIHPSGTDQAPLEFMRSMKLSIGPRGIFRQLSSSQEALRKEAHSTPLASSREITLSVDTTRVELRLGELMLQNGALLESLNLASGFDTLVVGRTKTVGEYLRSAPFLIDYGTLFKYRIGKRRTGTNAFPAGLQATMRLVDRMTKQPLASIAQISPNGLAQGRQDARLVHQIGQFSGHEAYVEIDLAGYTGNVGLRAIDYYHDPALSLPKEGAESPELRADIASFELEQNHPNPFERATEIALSLRNPAQVRLAVSNLLGQEVAVLADGYFPVGRHTFLFESGALPAGIYFCRARIDGAFRSITMQLVR